MALTKNDLSTIRQVVREEVAAHTDPFYRMDMDSVREQVKEGLTSLEREGSLPGPETMAELRAELTA